MKKTYIVAIAVGILVVIVMLAMRLNTKEIPIGTYIANGNMATITILNENEMRLYGPKEVSAAFTGQYVREGNKLVLSLAEQEDYIFLIEETDLVLESGEWLENWVEQGTVFYLSEVICYHSS